MYLYLKLYKKKKNFNEIDNIVGNYKSNIQQVFNIMCV